MLCKEGLIPKESSGLSKNLARLTFVSSRLGMQSFSTATSCILVRPTRVKQEDGQWFVRTTRYNLIATPSNIYKDNFFYVIGKKRSHVCTPSPSIQSPKCRRRWKRNYGLPEGSVYHGQTLLLSWPRHWKLQKSVILIKIDEKAKR